MMVSATKVEHINFNRSIDKGDAPSGERRSFRKTLNARRR